MHNVAESSVLPVANWMEIPKLPYTGPTQAPNVSPASFHCTMLDAAQGRVENPDAAAFAVSAQCREAVKQKKASVRFGVRAFISLSFVPCNNIHLFTDPGA